MKKQVLRSFFGAAITTLSGILPAVYFQNAWTLFGFAITGFIVGYHWAIFSQSLQKVKNNIQKIKKEWIAFEPSPRAERPSKLQTMYQATMKHFGIFYKKLMNTFIAFKLAPSVFKDWLHEETYYRNEVHQASIAQLLASMATYPVCTMTAYAYFDKPEDSFFFALFSLMLGMVSTMTLVSIKTDIHDNMLFTKRYADNKILFFATAFLKTAWIEIWLHVTITIFAVFSFTAGSVIVFSLFFMYMFACALVEALKKISALDSDTGLATLTISLVTGYIVYRQYLETMRESALQLILISVLASIFTGLVSATFSYLSIKFWNNKELVDALPKEERIEDFADTLLVIIKKYWLISAKLLPKGSRNPLSEID